MPIPRFKQEEIARLHTEGYGPVQIASMVNVSYMTVRCYTDPEFRAARKMEAIPVNPKREKREQERERKIMQMREAAGKRANNALYDPDRDGPPRYHSFSAEMLGDPPIGRQQILQRWAEENPDRKPGAHSQPQTFEPVKALDQRKTG